MERSGETKSEDSRPTPAEGFVFEDLENELRVNLDEEREAEVRLSLDDNSYLVVTVMPGAKPEFKGQRAGEAGGEKIGTHWKCGTAGKKSVITVPDFAVNPDSDIKLARTTKGESVLKFRTKTGPALISFSWGDSSAPESDIAVPNLSPPWIDPSRIGI